MSSHPQTIDVGSRSIDAELYKPEGDGPWPGVLLLHELFGLTDNVREDARDLARNGFLTLAPDLYSRMGRTRYCMRMFFSQAALTNPGTSKQVAEVHRCLDFLKEVPDCDGNLGMIGMCLTGGFVLQMARRPDMAAPVVYHHSFGLRGSGIPMTDTGEIKHTIQGHFAEYDRVLCPRSRIEALKIQLGDRLEVNTYPDIGHGIRSMCRNTPQAQQAWNKTVLFFDKNLR